jgi:hypothetical protein
VLESYRTRSSHLTTSLPRGGWCAHTWRARPVLSAEACWQHIAGAAAVTAVLAEAVEHQGVHSPIVASILHQCQLQASHDTSEFCLPDLKGWLACTQSLVHSPGSSVWLADACKHTLCKSRDISHIIDNERRPERDGVGALVLGHKTPQPAPLLALNQRSCAGANTAASVLSCEHGSGHSP